MRLLDTLLLQVSIPVKRIPHTNVLAQGPAWRANKVTEGGSVPELVLQTGKLRWPLHIYERVGRSSLEKHSQCFSNNRLLSP